VHGITHADSEAERDVLHDHVGEFLSEGAAIYCEQGIRSLYFPDWNGVCEMDDYLWAMERCRDLDIETHLDVSPDSAFEGISEDVDTLAAQLRSAVFSLIDSGGTLYGREFKHALGDVASSFLMSHEDRATGQNFESFTMTRRAAADPANLVDLQRYYQRNFLPQPVEREWLRRHDRELELMTHARNERIADYAVYHHDDEPTVHLVVGAAHQPGVRYYLDQFSRGTRTLSGFQPVG